METTSPSGPPSRVIAVLFFTLACVNRISIAQLPASFLGQEPLSILLPQDVVPDQVIPPLTTPQPTKPGVNHLTPEQLSTITQYLLQLAQTANTTKQPSLQVNQAIQTTLPPGYPGAPGWFEGPCLPPPPPTPKTNSTQTGKMSLKLLARLIEAMASNGQRLTDANSTISPVISHQSPQQVPGVVQQQTHLKAASKSQGSAAASPAEQLLQTGIGSQILMGSRSHSLINISNLTGAENLPTEPLAVPVPPTTTVNPTFGLSMAHAAISDYLQQAPGIPESLQTTLNQQPVSTSNPLGNAYDWFNRKTPVAKFNQHLFHPHGYKHVKKQPTNKHVHAHMIQGLGTMKRFGDVVQSAPSSLRQLEGQSLTSRSSLHNMAVPSDVRGIISKIKTAIPGVATTSSTVPQIMSQFIGKLQIPPLTLPQTPAQYANLNQIANLLPVMINSSPQSTNPWATDLNNTNLRHAIWNNSTVLNAGIPGGPIDLLNPPFVDPRLFSKRPVSVESQASQRRHATYQRGLIHEKMISQQGALQAKTSDLSSTKLIPDPPSLADINNIRVLFNNPIPIKSPSNFVDLAPNNPPSPSMRQTHTAINAPYRLSGGTVRKHHIYTPEQQKIANNRRNLEKGNEQKPTTTQQTVDTMQKIGQIGLHDTNKSEGAPASKSNLTKADYNPYNNYEYNYNSLFDSYYYDVGASNTISPQKTKQKTNVSPTTMTTSTKTAPTLPSLLKTTASASTKSRDRTNYPGLVPGNVINYYYIAPHRKIPRHPDMYASYQTAARDFQYQDSRLPQVMQAPITRPKPFLVPNSIAAQHGSTSDLSARKLSRLDPHIPHLSPDRAEQPPVTKSAANTIRAVIDRLPTRVDVKVPHEVPPVSVSSYRRGRRQAQPSLNLDFNVQTVSLIINRSVALLNRREKRTLGQLLDSMGVALPPALNDAASRSRRINRRQALSIQPSLSPFMPVHEPCVCMPIYEIDNEFRRLLTHSCHDQSLACACPVV